MFDDGFLRAVLLNFTSNALSVISIAKELVHLKAKGPWYAVKPKFH